WDSNPRRVAPHTLSKRADSAALAPLPDISRTEVRQTECGHASGAPATSDRSPAPRLCPTGHARDRDGPATRRLAMRDEVGFEPHRSSPGVRPLASWRPMRDEVGFEPHLSSHEPSRAESSRAGEPVHRPRPVGITCCAHPLGEVTVGSCATGSRESGQVREEAAFNGVARVPQIAWPSPHSAGASLCRCRVSGGGWPG
ncbi:MAG: hypothetical protein JWN99_3382, partial [Ilumatobacteraceae bacterium]|nr:hypothetical protein [Ilumatobacteraceae bacterium]